MTLGQAMFEEQLIFVEDLRDRETSGAAGVNRPKSQQMNVLEITSFQTRRKHDAVLPHLDDGSGESDQVE